MTCKGSMGPPFWEGTGGGGGKGQGKGEVGGGGLALREGGGRRVRPSPANLPVA